MQKINKIFLDKKYGAILLIICSCISFALSTLCASKFTLCCKDYNYVSNNTYIEEKAKVVNFTVSCFDYDGSGRQENNKPKFYLIEKKWVYSFKCKRCRIRKNICH